MNFLTVLRPVLTVLLCMRHILRPVLTVMHKMHILRPVGTCTHVPDVFSDVAD